MRKYKSVLMNILYAFGAQGISMILSVLMALFLPKVLGVKDYGYWQLFIFYTSYAGFFHFGFNDGVYLKEGGKDYDKLNFRQLNSDLAVITIAQLCMGVVVAIIATGFLHLEQERIFTINTTIIYIILCNYSGFLCYVLQLSNRIKSYSMSVVIDKICFIAVVIVGIFGNINNFKVYVIGYLLTKVLSTACVMLYCKELITARFIKPVSAFVDTINNIKVGINLTISNVASMLILGIGRSMIDSHWGVEAFGKFSLALSLSNFFLQFISQVSLVLFPTFRRLSEEKISEFYDGLRTLLSLILSGMLLLYMPLYYLLSSWLPQYVISLKYMVLLLPICTFDGKMTMLCNTYLKVLRKEKILLRMNVISMLTSAVLCLISTYIIQNIYAVTICMVISIAVRSLISENYLAVYFHKNIKRSLMIEVILSMVFVGFTWRYGAGGGFLIYLVAFSISWGIRRKDIKNLLDLVI